MQTSSGRRVTVMSLQRRLVWLLLAFAVFALLATAATIYAVRVHVEDAIESLQQTQAEADWVERVQLGLQEQHIRIREVSAGLREPGAHYFAERDRVLDDLRQVAEYALRRGQRDQAEHLLDLTSALRNAFEACLPHAAGASSAPARETLAKHIEGELLPAVNARLQQARETLDRARAGGVDKVVETNTQTLVMAVVVAVVGVGLVAAGSVLIRRWIFLPLRELEAAARQYARGDLKNPVAVTANDELGALGAAMHRMAESLTTAQHELRISEAKYRALFENLRDAAIICDARARVLECQDGNTGLLGRLARNCVGHSLLELVPVDGALDWSELIGRALTKGERVVATDVRFPLPDEPEKTATVDLISFPLNLGEEGVVAFVLRDVTAQRRSERQLRRAEAMEATITLARGVAHDFSSLLSGAIGSLTLLNAELTSGRPAELLRRALRACGQAVSLARTLLTFAGGDRGHPEVIDLHETIQLILESLDEDLFARIDVQTDLDPDVRVFIDRDQFTEIVLNLVRNACEAMPAGGVLRVFLRGGKLPAAADTDGPQTHAEFIVSDTGPGISPEVQERLFEPLFTTKEPQQRRSRGMGLAVVYAAAKNAGGHVQVRAGVGAGASFHVWLPLASDTAALEERALPAD